MIGLILDTNVLVRIDEAIRDRQFPAVLNWPPTEASCCSANRKLPLLLSHELEQVDIPDLEMIADVWDLRPFWVA